MKKVLCSNSKFERVFAHILDDGTIDIMRQDQRFTIIGKDFTLIGTNPQGSGKTVLVVKNGKLVEDGLEFKNKEDSNNGRQQEQPEDNEPAGQPGQQSGTEPESDERNGEVSEPVSGQPDLQPVGSQDERKHTVKG